MEAVALLSSVHSGSALPVSRSVRGPSHYIRLTSRDTRFGLAQTLRLLSIKILGSSRQFQAGYEIDKGGNHGKQRFQDRGKKRPTDPE